MLFPFNTSPTGWQTFIQNGKRELGLSLIHWKYVLTDLQHGVRRFKPVEKTPEERQQELQKIDEYKSLERLVSEKVRE